MEIEIDSKRNNPLLNRTEIFFTIKHEGEGTPTRELIRSELADKLNVKKETIVVNTIDSSFGKQEITGYAKVYSSLVKAKDTERDHLLIRNQLIEAEKKSGKKVEKRPEVPKAKESEEKPVEPEGEVESKTAEEPPKEESTPSEQPKEESAKTEEIKEESQDEKPVTDAPAEETNKEEQIKQEPPKEQSIKENDTTTDEEKPKEKPKEESAQNQEQSNEEKKE